MEPFGNSVHAALSQDLVNRNVLVTGCGPIGLMAIAIAKWAGARTICASDVGDFRLDLAGKMGADILLNGHKSIHDLEKVVTESTNGQGIDVHLEMSGSPSALLLGLTVLRNAGKAVFMGIHSQPVQIDVDSLITLKGISVYGAAGRRSDQTWERMRHVLVSGGIDLTPLITHEFPLDQIDKAFTLLQSRQAGKIIIWPSHDTIPEKTFHFAPSSSTQTSLIGSWHDAYNQPANQMLADIKTRELSLLKEELDNLFNDAHQNQQIIYGYKRQLLDSELGEKRKAKLNAQIQELEFALNKTRKRIREVQKRIEAIPGR